VDRGPVRLGHDVQECRPMTAGKIALALTLLPVAGLGLTLVFC
jgi:hypothetical protein